MVHTPPASKLIQAAPLLFGAVLGVKIPGFRVHLETESWVTATREGRTYYVGQTETHWILTRRADIGFRAASRWRARREISGPANRQRVGKWVRHVHQSARVFRNDLEQFSIPKIPTAKVEVRIEERLSFSVKRP